ncbi:hypothetical protein VNO77_19536 [Canavalia gladiata]|uniref:Uncharacterized protein n=1 Tax=Canavalia gladiata TaxID=3824 RepID=A0AAN9LRQ4_CANGL
MATFLFQQPSLGDLKSQKNLKSNAEVECYATAWHFAKRNKHPLTFFPSLFSHYHFCLYNGRTKPPRSSSSSAHSLSLEPELLLLSLSLADRVL